MGPWFRAAYGEVKTKSKQIEQRGCQGECPVPWPFAGEKICVSLLRYTNMDLNCLEANMELEQWFQKRKHSEHGPVTFSAFIEASLGGATLEGEETWQARKKSKATHEENMKQRKQRNALKM